MQTFDLDQFWPFPPAASDPMAGSAAPSTGLPRRTPAADHVKTDSTPRWDDAFGPEAYLVETGQNDQTQSWHSAIAQLQSKASAFLGSFDHKAALWVSTGFVAGMVSWHTIGFWGFVSEAVLYRGDRNVEVVMAERPPAIATKVVASVPITTGSITKADESPGACMALIFDRTTGTTAATACGNSPPFRDAGRGKRSDRLATAEARLQDKTAWSATTAVDPATQRIVVQPPAETDFNLTITPAQ
jgi:hypothetical protein